MTRPGARMTDEPGGIWDAVRRALGRLVGSVRVRELPTAGGIAAPRMATPEVLTLPAPSAGAAEGHWATETRTVFYPLPQALAGAGDADLVPLASIIAAGAALPPATAVVHPAPLPAAGCTVHRLPGDVAGSGQTVVHGAPVIPHFGGVRQSAVRLTAPGVAHLRTDPPALPRGGNPVWPGRRPASADLLSLAGGRVCSALAIAAEVPLTRVRRPVPSGAAIVPDRRRLAQAVGVPEEDVVLLGTFPQVPVAAVSRLALEDGGALSLWLKPEALAAAAAGKTPRLATLIVGRRRSTGKMIQTVA